MPDPGRRPLVAANWKMNKTAGEAEEFLERFMPASAELDGVDLVVCPPYTALQAAVAHTSDGTIRVAAQNMHFEASGAFTGEVSAGMLTDLGVEAVVLGHSERREHFGETDEALARKVPAALDAGLLPILCVGESEAQRDGGETEEVLRRQLEADLAEVDTSRLGEVVIAYEPIWAIGTGRTATTEQAQEACAFVRSLVAGRAPRPARRCAILYGGSMKPANAAELMAQPDVDGGLVGGASLDPEDFRGDLPSGGMSLLGGRGRPSRCQCWRWSSSTAGASPPRARATRSRRPTLRPSTSSGAAIRTPSSRRLAATSACRRGRWATPRLATSTSAPARSSSRTSPASTTPSPTAASSPTMCCAMPAGPPERARADACT